MWTTIRKIWALIGFGSFLVLASSLAVIGPDALTAEGLIRDPGIVFGLFIAPVVVLIVTLLFLVAPPLVRWNILLLLLFVAFAEVISSLAGTADRVGEGDPKSVDGNDYYVADARLGYRIVADNIAQHQKSIDGRTIYDVIYRIDHFGRRETPRAVATQSERFLLFFGGSNAFGQGLEQDETLPYHVTRALPVYRAYNYGLHGYGLAQMLDMLETVDLAGEVEERRGAAFYYFIPGHMARLVGASNVSSTWGRNFSYYTATPEGGLQYNGNFSQGRRWVTLGYALLARSSIVRRFGLVLPTVYSDADYELAARVAAESRRRLGAQVALDHFAVVLSPVTGQQQRTIVRQFARALKRHGIDVIDLSEAIDFSMARYRVAIDDYHQSGEANAILAAHLVEWLRERE